MRSVTHCVSFCLLLGAAGSASAAEPAPPPGAPEPTKEAAPIAPKKAPTETEEPSVAIGQVTVKGSRSGPLGSAEILTSVNIVNTELIRRGDVVETLDVLRRVPAVYLDTFNQGIITADAGIRGFNTQGDVAHVKLLVDGIPSNLHIGYADMKSIFPLEVDRIEVVKGTNDPRYGLNNVAGNINVVTRTSGNERISRLLVGNFGVIEPQALVGVDDGRFSQNYSLGYRGSSGFRRNSELDKFAGAGKWFYKPSRKLKVGLIARAMFMDADAPGYLSLEQARANPTRAESFALDDGGAQRNLHLSGHVDYALDDNVSWSLKLYGQSFLRRRWVRFDADANQQERIEDEDQYGAISVVTYRSKDPAMRGLALEWGLDYQLQNNIHQRFNTKARRAEGDPTRDHDFVLHTMGSFLQAQVRPVNPLKIMAGVRVDRVAGQFTDQLKQRELDINDYGTIWQPKLSVVFTPWKGQSLYGNYGRTFQIGTGIAAYANQAAPLAPSINDGFEVGYKTSPASWLAGRVAYWQQYASREVRLKFDDSGDSENVGETLRYGVDAELSLRILDQLSIWGAYSNIVSRQVEPGPASPNRKGKQLNHVPNFVAKGGIDYQPRSSLLLSVWCQAQGDYYLTKENDGDRFGGFVLVNANVIYDLTDRIQLGAEAKNILGQQYDTTVWFKDFGSAQGTQHNPGEPRAFYATITAAY